ncbi:MAG: DUF805 domain-containing protein [Actinomycetota bacterium]
MSFVDAIKAGFRNYANFKGRAMRSAYWWWALFTVLAQAAAGTVSESIGNLVSIALLLPSISAGVRRMHDIDRSGWWILFPIYNIVLLARRGDASENRFGPPPPPRMVP